MKKILFVLVLTSILSCGTRKKDTAERKVTVQTEFSGISRNSGNSQEILNSVANLQTKSVTKVDDQNQKVTSKKTFSPINPALPASLTDENGKKYDLINASYTQEETIEKNNKKSENSQDSRELLKVKSEKIIEKKGELKAIIKHDAKSDEAELHVDRKASSLWNLFWLLIPVILILLVVALWKKYKNKIS